MQPEKDRRREKRNRYYQELRKLAEEVVDKLFLLRANWSAPTDPDSRARLRAAILKAKRNTVTVTTFDALNRVIRVTEHRRSESEPVSSYPVSYA